MGEHHGEVVEGQAAGGEGERMGQGEHAAFRIGTQKAGQSSPVFSPAFIYGLLAINIILAVTPPLPPPLTCPLPPVSRVLPAICLMLSVSQLSQEGGGHLLRPARGR